MSTPAGGERALAFTGGRILSMDPAVGEPEVVVVVGDRIAAVGDRTVLGAHARAEIVDLEGRTLTPGFIDAHNHLSVAALLPAWVDLSTVHDESEALELLRAHARLHPEQDWIRAWGWNVLDTGLDVDADVLDRAGLDRPIVVVDFSFHRAAVSSAGLDALGIGRASADPPGGEIGRRPDGTPDGILHERAWSEACSAALEMEMASAEYGQRILARAQVLLGDGITCVNDAACAPEAEAAYRELHRAGRLPIGVVMMPHPRALLARLDASVLDRPVTGEGDELLRVGAVKLFADGGVAPAISGDVGGSHIEFGMLMPGLEDDMRLAVAAGFDVAVHSIGNAGFELTLEAWERARGPASGRRLRIEHACLLSPAQARRAAGLGVIAVVQPGFTRHIGKLLGSLHLEGMDWMPFATLRDSGLTVAASSDDPCALHEPVLTSAMGAARGVPGEAPLAPMSEALSYEEWLNAYTHGAAIAGGQQDERGRLAPGLRADLVVLDGELDPVNPPRVAETWVSGVRVHTAS